MSQSFVNMENCLLFFFFFFSWKRTNKTKGENEKMSIISVVKELLG